MFCVVNGREKMRAFQCISVVFFFLSVPISYGAPGLENITLPKGFSIKLYTDKVEDARSLSLGKEGFVFVGTRTGKVYAVLDADGDKKAEKVYTIASNLRMPNGISFFEGNLYVAENHRIIRYPDIISKLRKNQTVRAELLYGKLPTETHHGWKYLAVGPDKKLYFSVGAPCNVCKKDKSIYAAIHRINVNAPTNLQTVAHGIRNSVGFDWHPTTKQLWFTDNGRDWLGDNLPPDELNRLDKEGEHFGFPHCHSHVKDGDYGEGYDCGKAFKKPIQDLGAHVAALGMRFYTGTLFPEKYRRQLFIAEHGSWNRSSKVGYRITNVFLKEDGSTEYKVFAEGWLKKGASGDRVLGRPVDILNMPDGSLLVSDDFKGAMYRISWQSGN